MMRTQAQRQVRDIVARLRARGSAHDRHWRAHPAVATDDELTFGQRMADHMRSGLGTWTFLIVLAGIMAVWIASAGFGKDQFPYILLNLCLSTLAGIQAAVLLIAAKRADQISAATALHTLENTEQVKVLIEQNTTLTEQVATLIQQNTALTQAMHDHLLAVPTPRTRTTATRTR